MTDETGSPEGAAVTSVTLPADAPESFHSPLAAAEYFTALREKKPKEQSAESADDATAEQELPDEGNADPETDPSEQTNEAEPEALPPIERPRSWAKELDEEWASYPREAQEKIAKREQDRDAAIRRSQNEAAEERKAATAAREQAERARQEYEATIPQIAEAIKNWQNVQFPEVKNAADEATLAETDPFRYLQFLAHKNASQGVIAENEKIFLRQQQEQQTKWAELVQKENAKASEFIPELADKVKGPALTQRVATELLPDLGFTDSELNDLASGKTRLSIYDHRVQRLLADSIKLRDIQSAKTAVAAKPLPPVQRPGTARPSGQANSERIQALTRQLNETGSLKVAQELRALQSQRRAS